MKIRFAFSLGTMAPEPDALVAAADGAETAGFDSLWFSDLPVLASVDPQLAVAFTAAHSRRLHLGVNVVPFGVQPYVLARQLAQLDRLAGGRLLVTLVPGLDTPGERSALGTVGVHRGRRMDAVLPALRRWWAGEAMADPVTGGDETVLAVLPVQQPLEVWLGGQGPEAVRRAGQLADGWLGSLVAPAEAGRIRRAIEQEAAASGRHIDPEHFGLSIAYARTEDQRAAAPAAVRRRRPGADTARLVPVGADALRSLLGQLVDEGLSKFVLRPLTTAGPTVVDEITWLADAVLDLQT